MTQSKISDFFGQRGETQAFKDLVTPGDRRGTDNSGVKHCTPGGNSKRRLAARKLWDNLQVITYNCGSLSELRTHQIMREFQKKGVSVALIQGIRNPFSGERIVGDYKLFYEGSGDSAVDMHAGVIIAIKKHL